MAVEAAFVLPTFLLLLFGIFEFSMLLIGCCSGIYAANVGARYASLHSASSLNPATITQITNVVQANLFLPLGGTKPAVLVIYGDRSGSRPGNVVGDEVAVSVIVFSETVTIPFWGTRTVLMQCPTYRFVTR